MASAAEAAAGAAAGEPKVRTALDEMGKDGEFKRKSSVYRDWVRKGSGQYEPEGEHGLWFRRPGGDDISCQPG